MQTSVADGSRKKMESSHRGGQKEVPAGECTLHAVGDADLEASAQIQTDRAPSDSIMLPCPIPTTAQPVSDLEGMRSCERAPAQASRRAGGRACPSLKSFPSHERPVAWPSPSRICNANGGAGGGRSAPSESADEGRPALKSLPSARRKSPSDLAMHCVRTVECVVCKARECARVRACVRACVRALARCVRCVVLCIHACQVVPMRVHVRARVCAHIVGSGCSTTVGIGGRGPQACAEKHAYRYLHRRAYGHR